MAISGLRAKELLWLFLFINGHAHAQSEMVVQYRPGKPVTTATYFHNFPFDNYLETVSISDFQTLERDRRFLNHSGLGDPFLYHLSERHLSLQPLSAANIETTIALGERFLSYKPGISPLDNELYRNIGYFILGKAANHLSENIASGATTPKEPQTAALLGRLMQRQIYVTIAKSRWQKLCDNVGKGNLSYVARRLSLVFNAHWVPYQHLLGARKVWPLFLGLILLCTLLFLAFRRKRFVLAACLFFTAGPLLLGFVGIENHGYRASYTTEPFRFLHGNALVANRILNPNGNVVGHTIWLPGKLMRTDYLAQGDVPAQLQVLKQENHVFLATAGGFTNHLKQPEGLTIQAGSVVNAVLHPNRHGLVVLTTEDQIVAFNLKDPIMDLPDGTTLANPMNSLNAYAQFVDWCQANRVTVFQTQLVVHQNKLLIDTEKAVKRFRERRLVALVTDTQTGEKAQVLVNITEPHMLAPLSAEIFAILDEQGQRVDALLNLDVGAYDILEIYDERSQPIEDITGTSPSSTATNLIVYSIVNARAQAAVN